MSILKLKDGQGNWVGIPTVKGDDGKGISSTTLNSDYTLTLTFTDGTTYTTPSIRGEKGEKGEPATDMDIHICSSNEYDSETRIPTITNPNDKTFYLVPTVDGTSPDLFTEWVYVNGAWEMFGSASVDLTDYVKNTDYATGAKAGVIKLNPNYGINVTDDGILYINTAESKNAKMGTNNARPITPIIQHESIFYGLAKASGTDEKDSTLPVGQYTDEAKSSIQDMLDVPSNGELKEIKDSKADVIVESASGDIVSFNDGADNLPLKSLVVDINPVQDLHGQDAPYPAGGGKNLFDANTAVQGYYTSDDNGELIAGDASYASDYIEVDAGQTYRISPTLSSGNWGAWYDENKAFISGFTGYATAKTAPSNAKYLRFTVSRNGSNPNYATTTQVEKGSTATSYAPYENLCPISGWTGMNINVTGYNIWDEEWEVGGYAGSTGAAWNTNTRIRSKTTNYISVLPNTTYYVKMPSGTNMYLDIMFYNADKTFISRTNPNAGTAFTTPSDARFMRFASSVAYGTTYNHDISINYPSTDHSYHPYTGRSINIQLGQTVYGGKLDVLTGKLTIEMADVDLGTLTWTYQESYHRFNSSGIASRVKIPSSSNVNIGGLCSAYVVRSVSQVILNDNGLGVSTSGTIGIIDTRFTGPTEFKTAVDGVHYVYPLETPIEIQLTPTEVRSLLGTNNIFADTGNTSVEYCADTELYIEKVKPVVNVDDVQINGTSIVVDGVANVPIASGSALGAVKIGSTAYGLQIDATGLVKTYPANDTDIKGGTRSSRPVDSAHQHLSTFYGLAKAAGDTTQSQSSNAVGNYTEDAKSKIQSMLGITDKYSPKEWVAESETELVTNAHTVGDLFYIGETLYKVIADLNAGDAINVGVNVEEVNVNDILNDYATKEDVQDNVSIVEKNSSGSIASFNDGADNVPLKSLVVDINPVQDLHGYDSPWVAGGGVNKLPPMVDGTYTGNGVTAVVKNGVATLSGTTTASGNALIIPLTSEFTITEGYVHLCNSAVNASLGSTFEDANNVSASSATWAFSPANRIGTIPSNKVGQKWNRIRFYIASGVTISGTFSPMVCADNAARSYSPYENICPISGWTEVDVYDDPLHGGNIEWNQLCDNDFVNNYQKTGGASITKSEDSYTITYGTSNALVYLSAAYRRLHATSGQKMLVIVKNYNTTNKGTSTVRFSFETSLIAGNTIDETLPVSGAAIYTARSNIYGFGLYAIQNQDGNKISFDAISVFNLTQMFGAGNEPSTVDEFKALFPNDYYPYNEGEKTTVSAVNEKPYTHVTISLGQTVYGGKLDVLTGELTIDRAMVTLDGSALWSNYATRNGFSIGINDMLVGYRQNGISNYLVRNPSSGQCGFWLGVNNRTLYVLDVVGNIIAEQSATEWRAYLAEHPLQILYPLAEPVGIQLSPNQVNSLLGVNNIFADTGNTSVEYFSQVDKDLIDYIETSLKPYAKEERLNDYVSDVQIDGTSIVTNNVANVPIATQSVIGALYTASEADGKVGTHTYRAIVPQMQHSSVFYGLAKAAGDVTQSQSSNAVGVYTEDAKSAISDMLNGAVQVSGTDPTIVAKSGIRYVCGEVLSLDFTPSVSGICDVVFISGSTPTVLTITPPTGMTMKWSNNFDPAILEANATYEINIMDGYLGVVGKWT